MLHSLSLLLLILLTITLLTTTTTTNAITSPTTPNIISLTTPKTQPLDWSKSTIRSITRHTSSTSYTPNSKVLTAVLLVPSSSTLAQKRNQIQTVLRSTFDDELDSISSSKDAVYLSTSSNSTTKSIILSTPHNVKSVIGSIPLLCASSTVIYSVNYDTDDTDSKTYSYPPNSILISLIENLKKQEVKPKLNIIVNGHNTLSEETEVEILYTLHSKVKKLTGLKVESLFCDVSVSVSDGGTYVIENEDNGEVFEACVDRIEKRNKVGMKGSYVNSFNRLRSPFSKSTKYNIINDDDTKAKLNTQRNKITALTNQLSKEISPSQLKNMDDYGEAVDFKVKEVIEKFDDFVEEHAIAPANAKLLKSILLNELKQVVINNYVIRVNLVEKSEYLEFKKSISSLRVGPSVTSEISTVVEDALDSYSQKLSQLTSHHLPTYLPQKSTEEYSFLITEYSNTKRQAALSSPSYLPFPRKPLALSFHYLMPKPFGFLARDYRQSPSIGELSGGSGAGGGAMYTPKDGRSEVGVDGVNGEWWRKVVKMEEGGKGGFVFKRVGGDRV